MALDVTARYDMEHSTETLDLYTADFDDGVSIDFWLPAGSLMNTPTDIHVEFELGDEHGR